jgi:hypothetical protein
MLMPVCHKPMPRAFGGAAAGRGKPIAPANGRYRLSRSVNA